eukprot:2077463-Amphidinium_carterae.1
MELDSQTSLAKLSKPHAQCTSIEVSSCFTASAVHLIRVSEQGFAGALHSFLKRLGLMSLRALMRWPRGALRRARALARDCDKGVHQQRGVDGPFCCLTSPLTTTT